MNVQSQRRHQTTDLNLNQVQLAEDSHFPTSESVNIPPTFRGEWYHVPQRRADVTSSPLSVANTAVNTSCFTQSRGVSRSAAYYPEADKENVNESNSCSLAAYQLQEPLKCSSESPPGVPMVLSSSSYARNTNSNIQNAEASEPLLAARQQQYDSNPIGRSYRSPLHNSSLYWENNLAQSPDMTNIACHVLPPLPQQQQCYTTSLWNSRPLTTQSQISNQPPSPSLALPQSQYASEMGNRNLQSFSCLPSHQYPPQTSNLACQHNLHQNVHQHLNNPVHPVLTHQCSTEQHESNLISQDGRRITSRDGMPTNPPSEQYSCGAGCQGYGPGYQGYGPGYQGYGPGYQGYGGCYQGYGSGYPYGTGYAGGYGTGYIPGTGYTQVPQQYHPSVTSPSDPHLDYSQRVEAWIGEGCPDYYYLPNHPYASNSIPQPYPSSPAVVSPPTHNNPGAETAPSSSVPDTNALWNNRLSLPSSSASVPFMQQQYQPTYFASPPSPQQPAAIHKNCVGVTPPLKDIQTSVDNPLRPNCMNTNSSTTKCITDGNHGVSGFSGPYLSAAAIRRVNVDLDKARQTQEKRDAKKWWMLCSSIK